MVGASRRKNLMRNAEVAREVDSTLHFSVEKNEGVYDTKSVYESGSGLARLYSKHDAQLGAQYRFTVDYEFVSRAGLPETSISVLEVDVNEQIINKKDLVFNKLTEGFVSAEIRGQVSDSRVSYLIPIFGAKINLPKEQARIKFKNLKLTIN